MAVLGLEMRRVSSPRSLFVVSGVVGGPCDGGSLGASTATSSFGFARLFRGMAAVWESERKCLTPARKTVTTYKSTNNKYLNSSELRHSVEVKVEAWSWGKFEIDLMRSIQKRQLAASTLTSTFLTEL